MTRDSEIIHVTSVGSTNTKAMRLAREGAPTGTVVWADTQTEGRGRREKSWSSLPGNLYLSVVVRTELPLALSGRLSIGSSLLLALALNKEYGLNIRTKWPNDLRLEGGKLGGILVEAGPMTSGIPDWYVVGCGVNVSRAPRISGTPTASLQQAGVTVSPSELVWLVSESVKLASQIATDEAAWSELSANWRQLDDAVGPVKVTHRSESYRASGVALHTDGSLIIEREGARWTIQSAEVSIITDQ